jgi:uncharacterized protein
MEQAMIIAQTAAYVKETLANAEGGHDWWHIYRVWQCAKKLAEKEEADLLVVELAALLHDIADSKFHGGDEEVGPATARRFLETLGVQEGTIAHVEQIIRNISFKGGKEKAGFHSTELGIVQDADRLDAVGAIGIARAFSYGGFRNRKLYDPTIAPDLERTKESYKHNDAPTINHFYEKLFLLKDRMNTAAGRELALERHQFMEQFVDQFYREWEGG